MDDSGSFLERWSRLKRAHAKGAAPGTDQISSEPQGASATSGAHPATSPEQHYFDPAIPSETRRAALRELWRSEPLFAERDGLLDYDGDYSDEATVPARAVETAFVGTRGLLSESEAEAWAKLGRKNLSRRA